MTAVIVAGAGPAGLAAALVAARRGVPVTVLERAERVGGMAGSFEVDGVRVDFGSHRLHPSIRPDLLAELRRLLGADLQVRPRQGRIRLGGRWVGFPLRTTDLVRSLPPGFTARAARDALLAPVRRPRADTFTEVVRAGLGPTVSAAFYEPYARKLWGVDGSELSGELARRRISASSPAAVVARLARGTRQSGRTFLYPRTGFGTIAERLADAAVEAGASIELGVGVERVEVIGGGVRVHTGAGRSIEGSHLWSTLPLTALAAITDPAPPTVPELVHRGMVLVYLVLDRPRYSAFDAHYFPDEHVPLSRLSEPIRYRDNPDDPRDRTVLCAEIPCSVGDERWSANEEDLGAVVAGALAREGLPEARPQRVEVRRLPRVYAVHRPDSQWAQYALELWAGGLPGVVTLGRQGLFVPDNTHHVLAMGWAAGQALRADGSFDMDAWRTARDGFRAHVVED